MTSPVYRIESGTTRPLDSLQNDLNLYASRGFPLGASLEDAWQVPSLAPSGVLWGTTNTSSFAANANNMTATTTMTATFGNLRAVPFFHEVGHGIGGMGFRVTTGAANAVAVFGIYDSIDDGRGNFYPGKKLWQSTEVTPTANNTSHRQSPNLTIPPGHVYWMVYHGGVASPTVTAVAVAACSKLLGYSTGAGAPTLQTYLSGARTYNSTLPTLYPSGQTAVATAPPFLWGYYDPSLSQTLTRSFPIWAPAEEGYAVRGVRLLSGSPTVRSGSSRPSVKVKARIVNGAGAVVLGTFDSSKDVLKPGVPFYLTSPGTDSTVLAKDSILEAYVEQTGWPLLSVTGCRVCCDVVRTRP